MTRPRLFFGRLGTPKELGRIGIRDPCGMDSVSTHQLGGHKVCRLEKGQGWQGPRHRRRGRQFTRVTRWIPVVVWFRVTWGLSSTGPKQSPSWPKQASQALSWLAASGFGRNARDPVLASTRGPLGHWPRTPESEWRPSISSPSVRQTRPFQDQPCIYSIQRPPPTLLTHPSSTLNTTSLLAASTS